MITQPDQLFLCKKQSKKQTDKKKILHSQMKEKLNLLNESKTEKKKKIRVLMDLVL